ncbi:MarR family transcriptional regulator [Pseudomonas sp. TCU-HL1]|nr:MarR family transcriptional regulator [Pseudomonas sp. TCU-HL1]
MHPMLPTQCLCTKLRRATRNVTRLYDDALADVGLNVAQYSLLKHVTRLDQPSITSLAESMGLDRSTLGRNLKVLEAKDLVQLEGGEDQRNRLVSLTPAGRASLDAALQAWERVQQEMGQRMGPEKRAALMALLDDLEHIG